MGKLISQWNIIVQGALQYNDYSKCQYFFKYQKWSDNTYRAPISETLVCRLPDSRCEPDHTQESLGDLSPTGSWAISQQNHTGCKNGRGHLQFFLKSLREAVQPLASRLRVCDNQETHNKGFKQAQTSCDHSKTLQKFPLSGISTQLEHGYPVHMLSALGNLKLCCHSQHCVIPAGEIGHNNPAAHTELPALFGTWISPSPAWNPPTRAGQCSCSLSPWGRMVTAQYK